MRGSHRYLLYFSISKYIYIRYTPQGRAIRCENIIITILCVLRPRRQQSLDGFVLRGAVVVVTVATIAAGGQINSRNSIIVHGSRQNPYRRRARSKH